MKKFCMAVISFLMACLSMFSACGLLDESDSNGGGASNGGSSSKYQFIEGPTMTVDYSEFSDYSVEIKGTFKNTSGKDYNYVSLEFSLYDADGNNLGTAYDNISNLYAGDTWKFKATDMFLEEKPVRYQLADVTMW